MTRMPHLSAMTWDEDDHLRSTTPNAGATPQVTYYAYDAGGQRVRKVTDWQGTTVIKAQRIYLGAHRGLPGVRHRRHPHPGTRDPARRRRRADHRARREPHQRHRQGVQQSGPLPAFQPPGFGGPGTRRHREHHHVRGVLPVRQHVLPGSRPQRTRPRSGTATRERNATRKTACTTTVPATTPRGWGGGPAPIQRVSSTARTNIRMPETRQSATSTGQAWQPPILIKSRQTRGSWQKMPKLAPARQSTN